MKKGGTIKHDGQGINSGSSSSKSSKTDPGYGGPASTSRLHENNNRIKTISGNIIPNINNNGGFRPFGHASRSFMQKHMVRELLGPKYPDSERGESRQRASFLIDTNDVPKDRKKYDEYNRLNNIGKQSPSERSFSKTPRATLAVEESDGDSTPHESDRMKSSQSEGNSGNAGGENDHSNDKFMKKKSMFGTFLSKARNRR